MFILLFFGCGDTQKQYELISEKYEGVEIYLIPEKRFEYIVRTKKNQMRYLKFSAFNNKMVYDFVVFNNVKTNHKSID